MAEETRVVVYGSSRPREGSGPYEDARAIGRALARERWTVVTGGYAGVMEAASRGAKEAGGVVEGITTSFSTRKANSHICREIRVPSYGDRLLELTRRGHAFVVMPGGSGTLAELFLTWELEKNTSIPPGPMVLYGPAWRRIMECMGRELAEEHSFAYHLSLLHFAESPEETVEIIRAGLQRMRDGGPADAGARKKI